MFRMKTCGVERQSSGESYTILDKVNFVVVTLYIILIIIFINIIIFH